MKILKLKASQGGFAAMILVIAMMTALLLGSIEASSAALSYADSVLREEYRLQSLLDAKSCASIALLGFSHDYFYSSYNQAVSRFSCTIVSATRQGNLISISTSGYEHGVMSPFDISALDTGSSLQVIH